MLYSKARILIVEDESVVALDIDDHLQSLGYQVVGRATTGAQAVSLALEQQPDLILMDIKLKGDLDGVESAERILAQVDIPIIFLTAYADTATLQRAKNIEPFGYILKPFEGRELFAQIEMALYKHRMERALRESQERYELAVQGSNDGIWDWDLRSGKTFFSPRWKNILGYSDQDLNSDLQEWFGRTHPDDLGRLQAELANHIEGQNAHIEVEYRMQHQNGEWVWVLTRGQGKRDEAGRAYRLSGSQTDITRIKRAEERELCYISSDPQTELPNRLLLLERLAHLLSEEALRAQPFAILYLDVDNFCVINECFGYAGGDRVLLEICQRLKEVLGPDHTLARVDSDEFCILLENTTPEQATLLADQVLEIFKTPVKVSETMHAPVSVSMGLVPTRDRAVQPGELLQQGEMAMYQAKSRGKACWATFDAGYRQQLIARLVLETQLRQALERGEFQVYYQPILDLENCQAIGFEALLRWLPPGKEAVLPSQFIPLAEETGLIVPIGEWVMRQACRQMRHWQKIYPHTPPLQLSVNLSPRQFNHPMLPEKIAQILQETGLEPDCLNLEITETMVMADLTQANDIVQRLNRMSVHVHLDDFGTGYSSLSYLQNLEVQAIKLDRSFLVSIDQNRQNQLIVESILNLARSLGIDVVAEGIETRRQLEYLRSVFCELGQGYLFYMPLAPQEINEILVAYEVTTI